jgi:hypothetical protein
MNQKQAIAIAKEAITEQMKRYAVGYNLYKNFNAESQLHQFEKFERLSSALNALGGDIVNQASFFEVTR